MHVGLYLVPRNQISCAVGAEDGAGRILEIGIKIIADGLDDLRLVVARLISL